MRHYRLSIVLMLSVVCVSCATRSSVAWRAVDVQPHQMRYVLHGFDYDCWRVDFEVCNRTEREMVVDWNRDESAFLVDGRWESLGISALMPYLAPRSTRTFSLYAPHRAQACRITMRYKLGNSARFYRQLDLETKLPPNTEIGRKPFQHSHNAGT